MIVRRVAVVLLCALLSFHAVRSAAVSWRGARSPIALDNIWPAHPLVVRDQIMADIGSGAAKGQSPGAATLERLRELARKSPLAVEPFLIKGALAQLAGRDDVAEELFVEARRRDPRSPAARYFLGSRYLATNRIADGLQQIGVLTRLVSDADLQFVPALAAYAQSPGAVPPLRRFFQSSPRTEEAVLARLATDARNADLVLALASPRASAAGAEVPAWHRALVDQLVQAGEHEKAYAVWARLGGAPPTRALFNPAFRKVVATPPFNWAFEAGTAGVAEPSEKGLKIIYYSRDDAVLVRQLLVLPPGDYELAMPVQGASRIERLAWSLSCQPSKRSIASLAIVRPGIASTRFAVPASGCGAQLLELKGTSSEGAQPVELTIPKIDVARVGR